MTQKKTGPQGGGAEAKACATGGPCFASTIFYLLMVVLVAVYGVFLYSPEQFEATASSYPVLQPVHQFFLAVEKYSPFHEFANDGADVVTPKTPASAGESFRVVNGEKIFTPELLKAYDGSEGSPATYLAILGQVFDVSKGKDYYGPGGGYSFFSGKDGSRAFVTGEFNPEGLVDNIAGLTHQDYKGLEEWASFYNKDYTYVGKVVGSFYDEDGKEREHLREYRGWIAEADAEDAKRANEQQLFPPCNSEWSRAKGRRMWCTSKSGGEERGWVGRPRRLFYPGRTERCACVRDSGPPTANPDAKTNDGDLSSPMVKEYPDCPATATSCQIAPAEQEEEKKGEA